MPRVQGPRKADHESMTSLFIIKYRACFLQHVRHGSAPRDQLAQHGFEYHRADTVFSALVLEVDPTLVEAVQHAHAR